MGSNVLEVDTSLIENRLRIKEIDQEEEEFNKLFEGIKKPLPSQGIEDGIPWKIVTPLPGVCVKFFTVDGDKHFVNICHHKEMPPPKDLNDDELTCILESDNPSSYRIPMSLSDPHIETDKSGKPTNAYDVLVNSSLIQKIERSPLFQVFFITVVLEGIQEKYGISVNLTLQNPYIILKNRKSLGPLRAHRIQQRGKQAHRPQATQLIEEVPSPVSAGSRSSSLPPTDPKLKLEQHPADGQPEFLLARVKIKALSEKDVHLDVGEDRLIITATKRNQAFVDIFLPLNVDPENTTAEYSKLNQELRIHMPVMQ